MKPQQKQGQNEDYAGVYKQQNKRGWPHGPTVKVLAAKCDDPSSIPGTPVWREKTDTRAVL